MKRATRKSWAGALAVLAALALPALASAGAQSAGNVRLSDGRTFAHWAHPDDRASVRQRPSQRSRRVARLHFLTEDGFPEVYPVLRRFTDRDGRTWLRIRVRTNKPQLLPGRPSHGCVRVPNRPIKRLYRLMPIGTPVHIR